MEKSRKLIKNACILTMDENIGDFNKADILIEDSKIVQIGSGIDIKDADQIDASCMIALPGFVDCHRHVWQTNLRHATCDWTLNDYVIFIRALWANLYRPEDVYLGNYAGGLEALEAGVTTLVDHAHIMASPEHADAAIRGTKESKVRSVFCYGMWEVPEDGKIFESFTTPKWHFEDFYRIKSTHFSEKDQRVTLGVALNELELAEIDAIHEEIEFSRANGAQLVTIHLNSPTALFVKKISEAGLLGSDMLMSHGYYLTDEELRLLEKCDASVVATPDTELQMGMGSGITMRARKAEVNYTLGADISSNNSGDLFNQMRLSLQAQRAFNDQQTVDSGKWITQVAVKVRDVLESATIRGAKGAGLDSRIGSLTPGKEADIVLINRNCLSMVPEGDPAASVVMYASTGNVDTVMVSGEFVKKDGKMIGVDEPLLFDQLRTSNKFLMKKASEIDPKKISEIEALIQLSTVV